MSYPRRYGIIEYEFLFEDRRLDALSPSAFKIYTKIWVYCSAQHYQYLEFPTVANMIRTISGWGNVSTNTARRALREIDEQDLIVMCESHIFLPTIAEKYPVYKSWEREIVACRKLQRAGNSKAVARQNGLPVGNSEKVPEKAGKNDGSRSTCATMIPNFGTNVEQRLLKILRNSKIQSPHTQGIITFLEGGRIPEGVRGGGGWGVRGGVNVNINKKRRQEPSLKFPHSLIDKHSSPGSEGTPPFAHRSGGNEEGKKGEREDDLTTALLRVSETYSPPDIEMRLWCIRQQFPVKSNGLINSIAKADRNRLLGALYAALTTAKNPPGMLHHYLTTHVPPDSAMDAIRDITNNGHNPKLKRKERSRGKATELPV